MYRGQHQSVAELADVKKLERQLAAAVRRTCPAWLANQADDLVQTALLKVVDLLERREANEPLSSSYLWRVAYSAVVDEIRRQRRRRETALDTDESGWQPAGEDPNPEQRTSARRIGNGIRLCLQQLADSRRAAVTLYLLGHTVREVATLLQWKTKRADNLVYRGLDDLRKCLKKKGIEP